MQANKHSSSEQKGGTGLGSGQGKSSNEQNSKKNKEKDIDKEKEKDKGKSGSDYKGTREYSLFQFTTSLNSIVKIKEVILIFCNSI